MDFEHTLSKIYQTLIDDEEERKAHPCCANCRYYYTEYGYDGCKYWESPRENIYNDKCSNWN